MCGFGDHMIQHLLSQNITICTDIKVALLLFDDTMNAGTILHATCHLVIKKQHIDLGPLARLCSRTKGVYPKGSM